MVVVVVTVVTVVVVTVVVKLWRESHRDVLVPTLLGHFLRNPSDAERLAAAGGPVAAQNVTKIHCGKGATHANIVAL